MGQPKNTSLQQTVTEVEKIQRPDYFLLVRFYQCDEFESETVQISELPL